MSETVEDVRRDYQQHPDTFHLIRGFAECRFCSQTSGGYEYHKVGQPFKFICIQCLGLHKDQAPKGEIVDVKCSEGIKKMQVTVATSVTSWCDADFESIK